MATTIENPVALPELSKNDLSRYSRHLLLPEVGVEGQRKLKAAKVLCVGAGGLGAPLAFYLAAAGVGNLGLVDFDNVEESNLQRQIIHSTADVGRPKIDSAADKLHALNPYMNIIKHETMLTSENALDIIKGYDIVADGTDNFPTRYLVNDACVLAEIFRTPTPRSIALRARPASSPPRTAPATAASIPSRRRLGWFLPAPRAESSESCPDCWASFRPPRPSSSSLARASR